MNCKTKYSVIKQEMETQELGCYETFGILAQCGDETQLISDVTTDISFAAEIADSFNRNQLSIIHFTEALEDILN